MHQAVFFVFDTRAWKQSRRADEAQEGHWHGTKVLSTCLRCNVPLQRSQYLPAKQEMSDSLPVSEVNLQLKASKNQGKKLPFSIFLSWTTAQHRGRRALFISLSKLYFAAEIPNLHISLLGKSVFACGQEIVDEELWRLPLFEHWCTFRIT